MTQEEVERAISKMKTVIARHDGKLDEQAGLLDSVIKQLIERQNTHTQVLADMICAHTTANLIAFAALLRNLNVNVDTICQDLRFIIENIDKDQRPALVQALGFYLKACDDIGKPIDPAAISERVRPTLRIVAGSDFDAKTDCPPPR